MSPPVGPDFDPNDESLGGNISRGFHLLRTKRRRQVVWCIAYLDPEESITVREVAKSIASVEQSVPVREVSNQDYRTVYTNLVQNHLPELAEASVVDYDPERKTIKPGSNLEALAVIAGIAIPAIHLLWSDHM